MGNVLLIRRIFIFIGFGLMCMSTAAMAAISPLGPYQAEVLTDPNPAVFTFQSSIAHYNNYVIYAGDDGKIYAYSEASGTSTLVSDTSSLGNAWATVQGFVVSRNNYLYFHDNALTSNVYRLHLTDTWPAAYEILDTGITSAIFAFAENPWTDTIWFTAADFFGSGNSFYLYEIDNAFAAATLKASFVQPNSGGNGPIIFKNSNTVLYGEAVFGGNGYFHLVNSSTGELIRENYLTFANGLGDSTYGYNNRIYATTGGGKTIFEIQGIALKALGTTDDEARGITFGSAAFFVSEMVPWSGGPDDGQITFNKGWDPNTINEIAPLDPFRARAIADPAPQVFKYQSSLAYYNNYLIYTGADGKIYGYNLDSSASTVISDTSSLGTSYAAVQGFLVSADGYLYFHDNALTKNIYRLNLTDTWPVGYETLATGITSAIYGFTENPWNRSIWFASADFFGAGSNFYLYRVNSAFTGIRLNSAFEQPHGGGNGPIIFNNETTLLYGEAVFWGNGYFHRVDTVTGNILQEDYLTFDKGLGDATYGYDGLIYATSGGGNSVFEIDGDQKTRIATTHDEARGITFDGSSLNISTMVPFSGGGDDGEISLVQLWRSRVSGVQADQRVEDTVDLNDDGIPDNQQPNDILSVNSANGGGSMQIGVSPIGADGILESLEAVDAATIDESAGKPSDFPFDLVSYRLKVTSPDGTARVTVYFSEPAAAGARWYKYDPIDGWVDYSAHATFSTDRRSVTLELKDGDYGDFDRIVNGEIVDPGGVGIQQSTGGSSSSGGGGGGGGGCFIDTVGSQVPSRDRLLSCLLIAAAVLVGLCLGLIRKRENA